MCSPEGQLTCLDCGNPECLRCPQSTGWLADLCKDIDPRRPAKYEIDYIRIYQDKTDPSHTLGCDPPEYPTKQYIQDNWEKYTFNSYIKKEPLLVVQHGGGECSSDFDCGNDSGPGSEIDWQESVGGPPRASFCVDGKCECPPAWTGPFCQSPCVGDYAQCEATRSASSRMSLSLLLVTTSLVTGLLLVSSFE